MVLKFAKNSKWSVYSEYDRRLDKDEKKIPSFSYLKLEDDDGNRVEIHCFWIGYFESLVGAEIEHEHIESDERKFRVIEY